MSLGASEAGIRFEILPNPFWTIDRPEEAVELSHLFSRSEASILNVPSPTDR